MRTNLLLPLSVVVLLAAAAQSAHAQCPAHTVDYMGFKGRDYKDPVSGAILPYRYFIPAGYDPKKAYPLVLYLHHAGLAGDVQPSKTTDNCKQLTEEIGSGGYGGVFKNSAQAKYPHFIIAPHAQHNTYGWGGGMEGSLASPPHEIQALVYGILSDIRREFTIDPKRIYITGISMGCFGTWDMIMRNPTYFAAASPQSCGGDPAGLPKVVNLPIWDFCGSADQLFAVQSNKIAAAFKAMNPLDFTYTLIQGAGHSVHNLGYDWTGPPSLIDWIFSKTNKFSPGADGGPPGTVSDAGAGGAKDTGGADTAGASPDSASGMKADAAATSSPSSPDSGSTGSTTGPGGGTAKDAGSAPVDEDPAVGGTPTRKQSGGFLGCAVGAGTPGRQSRPSTLFGLLVLGLAVTLRFGRRRFSADP